MPDMLAHEGVWVGVYRHINLQGEVIDQHESRVECVFPDHGEEVYIQKNQFRWSDGKTKRVEFGGVLQDDRIFWDTDTFSGYGWVTREGVVMLKLDRKDVPNAYFVESIILGNNGVSRARTWHWFQDGELFQRTLCDEHRQ